MSIDVTLMRLSDELRRRRRERGMRQRDLAVLAGVSRALVIRAEKGDPSIAIGTVAKLFWSMGGELVVDTARRPTLEEAARLFNDED